MNFLLLYLFISAGIVRCFQLSQSLWLDEATTANVVKNLDAAGIINTFAPHDFHPPLYYLFLDVWTQVFGYSEFSLRLPSVLFSLLAGWLVYLTAKKISNKTTAFWAAAFFLFNPLVLYYSQEARMYMMVTALVAGAIYALSVRNYLIVGVLLGLSFLTFYGSIFATISVLMYLGWKRQWKGLILTLPGVGVGLLAAAPLLLTQLENSRSALAAVPNWHLVLGLPNVKNLFLIPIKFALGRITFEPKIVYYLVALVHTVVLGFFAIRGGLRNRWLLFLLGMPILLAFVISFRLPMLQYFRFLYVAPMLALLLALGTGVFMWERRLVMALSICGCLLYLLFPVFHREDWKHVLISVPESQPLYMIQDSSDPLKYYYPTRVIGNLKEIDALPVTTQDLSVISYTADIHGVPYRSILEKKGYGLVDTQDYRGVVIEYWKKN